LLDTGASRSFLSPEFLAKLSLEPAQADINLRLSTFKEDYRDTPASRVRIETVMVGRLSVPWDFLVVPGITHEALLGLDFIKENLLYYDPVTDHLLIPSLPDTRAPRHELVLQTLPALVTEPSNDAPDLPPALEDDTPPHLDVLLRANDIPMRDWAEATPLDANHSLSAGLVGEDVYATIFSVTADTPEEAQELADFRATLPADLLAVIDAAPQLFAPPDAEPPQRSVKHHIRLLPDAVPLKRGPYPLSGPKLVAMREQMEKLFQAGWIEPSHSPWGAPVIMVPKKSLEYRMCDDFRDLNTVTIDDSYPLPRLDVLLHRAGRAKFFSKIDLASGFHQIEVEKESRPYTSFRLPEAFRGHALWQ